MERSVVTLGSLYLHSSVPSVGYSVKLSFFHIIFFQAILGAHSLYDRYENGRRLVNVEEVIVHPEWSPDTFANDLALLRMANAVQTSGINYIIILYSMCDIEIYLNNKSFCSRIWLFTITFNKLVDKAGF